MAAPGKAVVIARRTRIVKNLCFILWLLVEWVLGTKDLFALVL
jgi:hypothetical protein